MGSLIAERKTNHKMRMNEVNAQIADLRRDVKMADAQEDKVIVGAILDVVSDIANGQGKTAAQLSAAVDGALTPREIAANMPYVGKPTGNRSRFEALHNLNYHVDSERRREKIRYAEINERGEIVPGGRVTTAVHEKTIYRVKPGPRPSRWY